VESPRNRIIVAIIVASTLFFFMGQILGPKIATRSRNARFNDWVKYYRRQDGYTVEYRRFETFEEETDVMRAVQVIQMSDDVAAFKDLMGAVTVYYDWEVERIFYTGAGEDPDLSYGFYCTF
jgi:hypothetical protein